MASGRTRATAATERRSVQEFPGLGTIESPNPRCFDKRRIEVTEVDSHPVPASLGRLPVRDTTTRCAPTQPKALVTPYVAVDASLASGDPDLARFIVAPQPGLPATDRAVAACQPSRLSRDLDLNRTAVARPGEHGTPLYVPLTLKVTDAPRRRSPSGKHEPTRLVDRNVRHELAA